MKKMMTLAACALFAFSSMLSSAQTDKKASTTKSTTKAATPASATTAPATTAPSTGPKLKKDGTPDKRYKENKAAKPAPGPTKKDGTPDMRNKANKEAAKK
jgi:hypothetical protein